MLFRHIQSLRRVFCILTVVVLASVSLAGASATLLLEEPYGKMGFFTATGHAAVYLSGVCADSPVVLRPCAPGESGIVLSRYNAVGGYDWLAISLIPYLYAVDRPEDVPLFADARMVAFLRDRYRRKYLESIAPDDANGATPGGNWYQLVGASYDRTVYGFEIETTREQDEALIRKLNSSPNRSHFHLVSSNCADFAKGILNFYYPKSFHRSVIADAGITTPKQIAKMLTKFTAHHSELDSSRLVFPQVPGSMPRSSASHGVLESFLKSKKYIVPSAIASPIFAGCVFAVYVGTGAGHFEPGRGALVFTPGSEPEPPIAGENRKAYQRKLKDLLAEVNLATSGHGIEKEWQRLQSRARTSLDDEGRPILQMQVGDHLVSVGASASNVLNGSAPPQFAQQILAARLQSELHHGSPHGISQALVTHDWNLLQQTLLRQTISKDDSPLTLGSVPALEDVRGNGP